MDMNEVLAALFEAVAEPDQARKAAFSRAVNMAEPHYARLREAVGAEEAEKIWAAALEIGSSGEEPIFQAGLCLGLRLMALCL